jgi:hypothetical protein
MAAVVVKVNVDPANYGPKLKQVTFEGTQLVIAEHPEWREHFLTAADELNVVANSPTIDLNTVLEIVNRLPVKELKSRDARLAISGARLLLVFVGVEIPVDKAEKLRPVVIALRDGIQDGLKQI